MTHATTDPLAGDVPIQAVIPERGHVRCVTAPEHCEGCND